MRSILLLLCTTALAFAGAPIQDARLSGTAEVTGTLQSKSGSTIDLRSGTLLLTNPSGVFGGDSGTGGTIGLVPAPASGDAAAGRVLGADGTWVLAASSLSSLQDATIDSPVSGEILQYDGSKWINAPAPTPISDLGDLGDVILTAPANGDVLTYSGSEWIAVPGGGAGGGGIIDPTIDKGDIVVRNATTIGRLPVGNDGDVLVADSTAAEGMRWAAKGVAARVYLTSERSLTGTVNLYVDWDEVSYDTASMYDPLQPTRLTVPVDGYYLVVASVGYDAMVTSTRITSIRRNGNTRIASSASTGSANLSTGWPVQVSAICYLEAGDYVETVAYVVSGNSTIKNHEERYTWMAVALLFEAQ